MIVHLSNGAFEVRGIPRAELERLLSRAAGGAGWQPIFAVFVGILNGGERLPMLGTYRIERGRLRFEPRYPLIPGQQYTAVFDPDGAGDALPEGASSRRIEARFELPEAGGPPAKVLAIHPSADVLPENLLRFHLCFSAPMREGEAEKHVRLFDEDGREVTGVFADAGVELWDGSMTRLTLLLDPGRVKSGLVAHELLGRALVVGRSYRLVIDERFRDARGKPLLSSLEKRFAVTAASASGPEVKSWRIEAPPAGTREPLTVRFPEPMDILLLGELIAVRGIRGAALRGTIGVTENETEWQLFPAEPWERGGHALEVDCRLEDVAGNNLRGLFDRPGQTVETPQAGKTVTVPFLIR